MQVQDVLPWLKEYVDPVNSAIDRLKISGGSTALEEAVGDALSSGGKRVRATLALLWCETFSGDFGPAVPLAVAYELAHASALVQDDVLDHSGTRRGKESIVAKYGLSTAILASDLLLFNVPKMFATYSNLGSKKLARIFDLLGEACRASTWGEFIDMELTRGLNENERAYEEMIRLKTSSLLSAPAASGAMIGGASDQEADTAKRFGEEVGLAYQIQDDTLDLVGDESSLGKPVLTDMRGGKKGLVLIHCLSKCAGDDREFVLSLLNRQGAYMEEEMSRLRGILEENGSLDYAHDKVLRHTAAARDIIGTLPENSAKIRLLELTDFLAVRYY